MYDYHYKWHQKQINAMYNKPWKRLLLGSKNIEKIKSVSAKLSIVDRATESLNDHDYEHNRAVHVTWNPESNQFEVYKGKSN